MALQVEAVVVAAEAQGATVVGSGVGIASVVASSGPVSGVGTVVAEGVRLGLSQILLSILNGEDGHEGDEGKQEEELQENPTLLSGIHFTLSTFFNSQKGGTNLEHFYVWFWGVVWFSQETLKGKLMLSGWAARAFIGGHKSRDPEGMMHLGFGKANSPSNLRQKNLEVIAL